MRILALSTFIALILFVLGCSVSGRSELQATDPQATQLSNAAIDHWILEQFQACKVGFGVNEIYFCKSARFTTEPFSKVSPLNDSFGCSASEEAGCDSIVSFEMYSPYYEREKYRSWNKQVYDIIDEILQRRQMHANLSAALPRKITYPDYYDSCINLCDAVVRLKFTSGPQWTAAIDEINKALRMYEPETNRHYVISQIERLGISIAFVFEYNPKTKYQDKYCPDENSPFCNHPLRLYSEFMTDRADQVLLLNKLISWNSSVKRTTTDQTDIIRAIDQAFAFITPDTDSIQRLQKWRGYQEKTDMRLKVTLLQYPVSFSRDEVRKLEELYHPTGAFYAEINADLGSN